MSRCFPYPPPGYTLSRPSEALIESIKLQKEREKSKEQRKKEKKERKERRKGKKEKGEEKRKEKKEKRGTTHPNLDKSALFQGHSGYTFRADAKGVSLCKRRETENEQLERSSLTEEHGQPDCLPATSASSDSTENSNKRKRHTTPEQGNHAHGKIIRIRLTSKKQLNTPPNQQQLCSTSGRTQSPAADKDGIGFRDRTDELSRTLEGNSNTCEGIGVGAGAELIRPRPPLQIVDVPRGETETPSIPKLTKAQRRELRYQNLFRNWVPPQLQVSALPHDDDDQDWLFAGKKENLHAGKRQKTGDHSISCSSSSALWPRAHYLHEVDVFALPYTVPF